MSRVDQSSQPIPELDQESLLNNTRLETGVSHATLNLNQTPLDATSAASFTTVASISEPTFETIHGPTRTLPVMCPSVYAWNHPPRVGEFLDLEDTSLFIDNVDTPVVPARNYVDDHMTADHYPSDPDTIFTDITNASGPYSFAESFRIPPPCQFCAAKTFDGPPTRCEYCALNADFIEEIKPRGTRFEVLPTIHYDPDAILRPSPFEPSYSGQDDMPPPDISLTNIHSLDNLEPEDERLKQIIDSYFNDEPPKQTLRQKIKGKLVEISAKYNRRKNPFKGSDYEEIFAAMENLYAKSVANDPSVCDDPYERELVMLRDHYMWPMIADKKRFQRIATALRLRYGTKSVEYTVVCYLMDSYKEAHARARLEPQGWDVVVSYTWFYLKVYAFAIFVSLIMQFCFHLLKVVKEVYNMTPQQRSEAARIHNEKKAIERYLYEVDQTRKRRAVFEPQGFMPQWNIKHELAPEITEKIDNVSDEVSEALKAMEETLKTVSTTAEQLTDVIKALPMLLTVISLAVMCTSSNRRIWIPVFLAAVTYVMASYSEDIKQKVRRFVDQLTVDPESEVIFEAQVNNESPIVGLALLLTTVATLGEAPTGKRSTTFLRGIGEIPKLTDGLTTVTAFVIDLIVKCTNEISHMILGTDVEAWSVATVSVVDTWCEKVRAMCKELHDGTLAFNMINRDRVFALEYEHAKLSSEVFSGVEAVRVKNALLVYSRMLKRVSDAFACISPNRKSVRQEPYVICLAGPPGVGKSWTCHMLISRLLPRILPPEELEAYRRNEGDYVWFRFVEEEYHTDYQNQFVTVFDDFMQMRDVLGQPGELMDFIRMVNSAPYTLHMADLASKGKFQFSSKLVVLNTNQKSFEVCSIQSKEAFLRRQHMLLHTGVQPKFRTPETLENTDPWQHRLNRSHPELKDENGVQRYNPGVNEFFRARYRDMQNQPDQYYYEPQTFDLDSLIDQIVVEYNARKSIADNYYAQMRAAVERGVDQRFLEPQAFTIERPRFLASKVTRALPSDLTIDQLDDAEEESPLTAAALFPLDPKLHALGNARDVANFLFAKYPLIWKHMTKQTPDEYAVDPANVETDYLEMTKMVAKIRKDPKRADAMDVHVGRYLTEDFLLEEHTARNDMLTYFDDVKAEAATFLSKYPGLTKMLKVAGLLGTVGAVVFGMWKAFGAFAPKEIEFEYEPESNPKQKTKGRTNRGVQRHGKAEFVPEAGGDRNNYELTKKLVIKSLYAMTIGPIKIGNAFAYRGDRCLIPYHYVTKLRSKIEEGEFELDDEIDFRAYHSSVSMPVTIRTVLDARRTEALKEKDLCVFLLPKHFHSHPDMLPHFASETLHAKNLSLEATLIVPDNDFISRERLTAVPMHSVKIKATDEPYTVKDCYMYPCNTHRGDCGSILTLDDTSIKEKIFALHAAGTVSTGTGLAAALVREDFEEVEQCFIDMGHRAFPPPPEVSLEPQADMAPAPGFHPYLTLPKKIYGPTESKIRKSLLYGAIATVATQPALLKRTRGPNGWIDPRVNAISRYSLPCISKVTPETVGMCTQSLLSHMMSRSKTTNIEGLISFEDAVVGRHGVKFFDAIPRNTSAGYPYAANPQKGYKHKEWFFGKGQDYDLDRPACRALKDECLTVLEKAKRGERSFLPYIDTLKDETLPHAKVEIGKTRLVNACPLVTTVVTRMLFLSFSKWMMDNRGLNFSAIGSNPYTEWDTFTKNLKSKGPGVVAGDFSGYDSRQLSVILLAICDMINKWYDDEPELQLARLTMFHEVINSIHISGDTVYQWASKLPSGHPLTSILNTCQTLVLLMLCWVDLNPRGEAGLEDFWRECYPLVYGDDHVVNISPSALQFYNFRTIKECMTKWNQVYTDETKTGVDYDAKALEDCTFLRRGFRKEERINAYVAPLAIASILDMLNWYTEGPERLHVQKTNVDTALRELALHDKDTFAHYSEKILNASRKLLNYVPPTTSYRVLQDACLAEELAW